MKILNEKDFPIERMLHQEFIFLNAFTTTLEYSRPTQLKVWEI